MQKTAEGKNCDKPKKQLHRSMTRYLQYFSVFLRVLRG